MQVVAIEKRVSMEKVHELANERPIELVRMLIGEKASATITAAVAEYCAGRLAWRDSVVKRYLDFGT